MEEANKYRLVGAGVMLLFTLVLLPLLFHRQGDPLIPPQREAYLPSDIRDAKSKIPQKVVESTPFESSPVVEVDLDEPPAVVPQPLVGHKLEPLKVTHQPQPSLADKMVSETGDLDPLGKSETVVKKAIVEKPIVEKSKVEKNDPVKSVKTETIKTQLKPKAQVATKPLVKAKPVVAHQVPTVMPKAGWVIQVASLSDSAHAGRLVADLKAKGFPAFTQVTKTPRGLPLTRVLIGPDQYRSKADARLRLVSEKAHVKAIVVRYPIGSKG